MIRRLLPDRVLASGLRLFLMLLTLSSCGGGEQTSEPSTKPLPVLVSASPEMLVMGENASLTLTGSGFVRSSQARWNNGDRVTHYRDAQKLIMDLLPSDLGYTSYGRVTVVNGAPGGGTSGVLSVGVGFPQPKVASVTPSTMPTQSTSGSNAPITITVVGSGFVQESLVRIGLGSANPTSITPTRIVATVSAFLLDTPGQRSLTVANPPPGGGTSNAIDFGVTYPVPTLLSVSPDSTVTGPAFTLTVNGTGFSSGTVVRWNGNARPTTLISDTRVTAAIPASDVNVVTIATISVMNPTPGGGASRTLSFRVRETPPLITGISPGSITAGAVPTDVTITGTNFRSGATAQWDGQGRSATITSTTSMIVTLSSADLANARIGRLTITNPGNSGVSNEMALAVLAANATIWVTSSVALSNADIIGDDLRGVIYASVPSTSREYANSVVRIDPTSGAVTGSVSVGSNPGPLAITDDGQFLYVGLRGAPKVVRVALSTLSKDIDIDLSDDGFFGSAFAEDIVPIPGSPRTFAVSMYYTGLSPRNAGTLVYDDGVRRTLKGPRHTGSNRITRSASAARIYGYNNESTEFGFRSVLVSPDGLLQELVKPGLVSGFGADIEFSGGFIYATTGEVADPAAMQKLGTIPANGVVRPDAANARVHFMSGSSIRTFHYTEFTSLGTFSDASLGSQTKLIRWGTDGLAAGGSGTIVLLRGGQVAP